MDDDDWYDCRNDGDKGDKADDKSRVTTKEPRRIPEGIVKA